MKIVSTTYCEDEACPGHRTEREYPGQRLVLTDNPEEPLALIGSDSEGEGQ